jgi:hypothetical protein
VLERLIFMLYILISMSPPACPLADFRFYQHYRLVWPFVRTQKEKKKKHGHDKNCIKCLANLHG